MVTTEGRAIAASAYPASCFADLSRGAAEAFCDVLEQQLRALQRSKGSRTFGQCSTCRFFEPRARGGRCGLTGEGLTSADSLKICREHEHDAA